MHKLSQQAELCLQFLQQIFKKNNCFPLKIYEVLYNLCVTSISDYGHEVIGFHQYPATEKLYSILVKLPPLCGLRSDMSWPEPRSRTQARMFGYYLHLRDLPDNRINKIKKIT